jgi:hypothetical protein
MDDIVLQQNEKVLLVLRKHWLVFVFNLIPFVLLSLLPIVFIIALSNPAFQLPSSIDSFISFDHVWVRFVIGIYWLFVWLEAFSNFIRFYFDIWIVTNLRIIDVEQHDFFDREVNSLFINSVEDITVEETGLLETFFHYGDIYIQTAGSRERTVFPSLPNPLKVRNLVMEHMRLIEDIQPDATQNPA